MYKEALKRVIPCLVIILLTRMLIINGLDKINEITTNYINAIDNQVSINVKFDDIYAINNLKNNNDVLNFNMKTDNNEYILFVGSLIFYHEIYLNDKLYSQNIDDNEKKYDSNFAYKTIEINDISDIRIKGNQLDKLEIFIAKKSIMESAIEKKTIFYTIKFICLFLLVILFVVMHLYDKKERIFVIFILIGITSIIKSIALGELPTLAKLMNVNIVNYYIFAKVTTVINTVLPIFIMLNLFEIKITKSIYRCIYAVLLLTVIVLCVDYLKYFGIVFIVFYYVKTFIILYGTAHEKKYYKVVCFNSIMYFSFAVYKINVLEGRFRTGILHFYTNTAYIGAIIYLIIFAIIFLKKYKNRIEESIKKEKEFERIILLRGISHDLKLPLSVIKISSQMIESGKLNNKQVKECANDITQEVNTLEKMTNNINAFLKLGYKDGEHYNTSIKSIFKRIERDFELINNDNKYDFSVSTEIKDCYVNIDELELYRLLYNLVDNSFKYCNHNDSISLSYKIEDKLIITVEDTGAGIDPKQINRIFSPFFRLDHSRNKEGMGLGLTVVKGIIDKCGGEINVISEINKGTKIIISI